MLRIGSSRSGFEDDLLAGNAALGVRQMTNSGFNLGAWLGLDVFQSAADNTFGQVSGGIEALSTWFDFRANGYLPFTDPQTSADGTAEVILTGPDALRRGEIYMLGGKEVAAYGADAEAGFRLPFGDNLGHLGVYGGAYWYDADDLNESVTGGMARVELAFNDILGPGSRLTAGYRYTDDNVNGGNHMVGGALRIPLGPAPALASQSQRMIDPLERNPNIYIGQSGPEQVEDGYTEVRFDEVNYSDTDTELNADIGLGPNRLLILDGSNNPITGQFELEEKQTLAGGGSKLKVEGVDSGTVAYADIPGVRPTIEHMPGPVGSGFTGYALTLNGYNTVNGVDVVAEIPDTGSIVGVTLGGINGVGKEVIAIVDTDVTVAMTGSGADGLDIGQGNGGAGEAGISDSALFGINVSGAQQVWLLDAAVTASMTGTGGDGGDSGSSNGGSGGAGVGNSTLSAIDLSGADQVWIYSTALSAWINGTGGTGGVGDGGNGGAGGAGISNSDSRLDGIDLDEAAHVRLANTAVSAWMDGTGANGGGGPAGGGDGGDGIFESTLYGIEVTDALDTTLEDTTITISTISDGGDGGLGGSDGADLPSGDFDWINPPNPAGVTLITPPVFLP